MKLFIILKLQAVSRVQHENKPWNMPSIDRFGWTHAEKYPFVEDRDGMLFTGVTQVIEHKIPILKWS